MDLNCFIGLTNAVIDPRTVMIKTCYASITCRTMFRPHRSSNQATAAK